jgi:hypothetical protein
MTDVKADEKMLAEYFAKGGKVTVLPAKDGRSKVSVSSRKRKEQYDPSGAIAHENNEEREFLTF